jgi:hypothetical protein
MDRPLAGELAGYLNSAVGVGEPARRYVNALRSVDVEDFSPEAVEARVLTRPERLVAAEMHSHGSVKRLPGLRRGRI